MIPVPVVVERNIKNAVWSLNNDFEIRKSPPDAI